MSPVYRQVTAADGDVELAPITIPQMEIITVDIKTGKVVNIAPFRESFWGRIYTGARLDLPYTAKRHQWVPLPWGRPNPTFTGGMCVHCGDFMRKRDQSPYCRGPGFP